MSPDRSAMSQLLLDLEPPLRPTFDNFVVGDNAEAVAAVHRLCEDGAGAAAATSRLLFLWGEPGSGRSHLLRAATERCAGRYLAGRAATPDDADANAEAIASEAATRPKLLAIDDVDALDASAQEALFHAINRLRDAPTTALLVAGNAAPRDLPLAAERDDLRSRLAWGLVYRLQRLDDDAKDAALEHHARLRGFPLNAEVRRYLLTHCARDLGSLMQMVDTLDRHAREQRRVVTVPMIRDVLQRAASQVPHSSEAA